MEEAFYEFSTSGSASVDFHMDSALNCNVGILATVPSGSTLTAKLFPAMNVGLGRRVSRTQTLGDLVFVGPVTDVCDIWQNLLPGEYRVTMTVTGGGTATGNVMVDDWRR